MLATETSGDTGGAGSSNNAKLAADAASVPCRIFLPVVPAARVIGKGGASIRAIREESGATVRILQKELPSVMQQREDRVIVISGEAPAMQEAIGRVLERVFDRSGLPDGVERARDRDHIVEVIVPEKSGSHFIGQKGERIKGLIEETRCDLNVMKEPMAELLDQKKIRVTASTADDAARAIWRLQELLGELTSGGLLKPEHFDLREAYSNGRSVPSAQQRSDRVNTREVPIRLLCAKDDGAFIVGRKGAKITRLRELAKVQMNDADSPPFDSTERVVEISIAPLERRIRVVQLIVEDLASRQEGCGDLRLLIPTDQFGSVMGHRGETIRGIMQSTGVNLQQHKAERLENGTEYHLRLVEVKGGHRQCLEAVEQIYNAIESRGRSSAAPPSQSGDHFRIDSGAQAFGRSSTISHEAANNNSLLWSTSSAPAISGKPPPSPMYGGALYESLGAGGLVSELGGLSISGGSDSPTKGRTVALQLAMPNEEVARVLANDSSGIAWRAGVKLSVGAGPGGIPILEISGSAVGNSVACYLIQDRLFMMH